MLRHFKDTINDNDITLRNFHELGSPNPQYMKDRMKRVAKVIKSMGDKYCLAVAVEKKNG